MINNQKEELGQKIFLLAKHELCNTCWYNLEDTVQ